MLEIEDQRCCDEHADHARQEVEPRNDCAGMFVSMLERLDDLAAAGTAVGQARADSRAVVDGSHVQPEGDERCSSEREGQRDERELEALQPPREPDHEASSSYAVERPRYASTISSSPTSSTCQRES